MHIPAKVEYGLRALFTLAEVGTPQTAESLAEAQGLPSKFLGAILADLRRAGLVTSQRGLTVGIDSPVRPKKFPLLMSCAPLTVPSLKSEAFAQSKPTTTVLRPTSKMFGSLLEPHFARCSSASPWLML